ncbi:sensor histidine kinase [Sphingomonas sp. ACRSK]|uniref:sensor histidine kinase n=1 Tax=Sphingomonas sp. ACRSK TaxID=2918213 RepID=UPI001EF4CE7F|nr:ATP-binding protein [Sphingomonas sp. ACRSK]
MISFLVAAFAAGSADAAVRQFEILNAAASSRMVSDPGAALNIAREAERRARTIPGDRTRELARSLWLQADAAIRLGQVEKGRALVELAMQEASGIRDPKLQGDLLLTRGAANAADGRVAAALADFQHAHGRFVEAKDQRSQALALARLASLYREGGDFPGALRYYNQAEEAAREDRILLLAIYNGRGNVLTEMNRFTEASTAFDKALKYAPIDNVAARARILSNLGRAQLNSRQLLAARRTIDEGVRLAELAQNPELTSQVYSVAARVALEQGHLSKARTLIEQSFGGVALAETTLAMRDNHLVAARIYQRSGEPEKAVEHLLALRRLDEQALSVATSAKAALMGARFDFQNQELRIARLKAEELRRNVEFERSRTRFQQILFGGIAAAVAILVGLLTFGLITIRRSRNEVRAANVGLGVANASLEKALAAKTEFLATTSHEIRTPLNGILGMTQVMLADPALEPATRERVDIVHGAGMRMRGMVDDILDVAKMENGNFTIDTTTVDLPATLKEATQLWEEQAQGRAIAFSLECADVPQWIESDPTRLRQIVFNLLSNALKFTHAGSIAVRATVVEDDGARRLQIAVRDTGIGIPADKHAQIFESFRQVDAGTTRQYGGTGLGLTICRNLAVALGGTIRVESVEGVGSTFTVVLPLVEAAAPAMADGSAGAAAGMLVVDRNPIVRGMMRTLFAPHVLELRFAASVEEALDELAKGGIARVLIDEAALEADTDDPKARVEPIASAARAAGATTTILWPNLDERTRAALEAAGMDQVIGKPISGARLVQLLFATKRRNPGDSPLVSRAA